MSARMVTCAAVTPSGWMCAAVFCAGFLGFAAPTAAETTSDAGLRLGASTVLVQAPTPVSPSALAFDATGALQVAWFEKSGTVGTVKTLRMTEQADAVPSAVVVNPAGRGPDAIHQSPGLSVGPQGHVGITWSAANVASGVMFASDLLFAGSRDGGATFGAPVPINDDGKPIPHTFESVSEGDAGDLYVGWLDGRNRDRSGAGMQFACSRDGGATFGSNLTVDGMACPCCRPMVATAPDGTVWVAWRKTFEGNVRDIVVAQSQDRGRTFSAPHLVSRDRWVFEACPHRGPSIGFDAQGRVYVGWYTEGRDEQPRIYVAASEDGGLSFSTPVPLHTSTTSLPDNLRMVVHPSGAVIALWEEVTGVRKRVVARVSMDRGRSFGAIIPLSRGAKAEHPTVAVHADGRVAIAWTEHAFPNNRLIVQWAHLAESAPTKDSQPSASPASSDSQGK